MILHCDKTVTHTIKRLREFTDIAVIGLSGGADSTVVASLCVQALGEKNVYGIHMPYSETDRNEHNSMSLNIGKYLDINNITHDIYKAVDECEKQAQFQLGKRFHEDLTTRQWNLLLGNVKARERMQVLYTYNELVAHATGKKCRVIGTGNLSEDFIGYATKYGDLGVDINPIGDLFKSEVYQLLDYFKDLGVIKEEHINRIPSANLWERQTDEEEIGMTYDEMEPIIHDLMQPHGLGRPVDKEIYNKVKKLYYSNLHKTEPIPVINLTQFTDRVVSR